MLRQVKSFTQRKLADALRLRDLSVDMAALLVSVKVAMLELDQVIITLLRHLPLYCDVWLSFHALIVSHSLCISKLA
jgi:hypothetical protein